MDSATKQPLLWRGLGRLLALLLFYPFTLLPLSAAYVDTDRPWYLAGEAMEVSVSDADALVAYAELCDTHGLAAGVVVGLKGGQGTGIIELPSRLHSGYYVLSVYTRDDSQVSQQLVAIVNPLHKSVDDDITWVSEDNVEAPSSLLLPPS